MLLVNNATLAAAWTPIFWEASPALAIIPAISLWNCHKIIPWLGAMAGVQAMNGKAGVGLLALGALFSVQWRRHGFLSEQFRWRIQTYCITLWETHYHPWVGNSRVPLSEPFMLLKNHAPLPSIHSDWISLAFHFGWPAMLVARLLFSYQIRPFSKELRVRAIQASLLSIGIMAWFQSVIIQPGIVLTIALLLLMKGKLNESV